MDEPEAWLHMTDIEQGLHQAVARAIQHMWPNMAALVQMCEAAHDALREHSTALADGDPLAVSGTAAVAGFLLFRYVSKVAELAEAIGTRHDLLEVAVTAACVHPDADVDRWTRQFLRIEDETPI
jgi:hypothetical protein